VLGVGRSVGALLGGRGHEFRMTARTRRSCTSSVLFDASGAFVEVRLQMSRFVFANVDFHHKGFL
jgi:hypothetical protein